MPTQLLFVDDADILLRLYGHFFRDQGDYVVRVAESGFEALRLISAGPAIDVMFVDLNMPDMTGPDLIARARGLKNCAGASIFVLSAEEQTAKVSEALRKGATGYVQKPVTRQRLLGLLRSYAPSASYPHFVPASAGPR